MNSTLPNAHDHPKREVHCLPGQPRYGTYDMVSLLRLAPKVKVHRTSIVHLQGGVNRKGYMRTNL